MSQLIAGNGQQKFVYSNCKGKCSEWNECYKELSSRHIVDGKWVKNYSVICNRITISELRYCLEDKCKSE